MKLIKTKIPGPLLIKSKIFKDNRGYLKETFRNKLLSKKNFPFDVMSSSKKKVLRGLHFQIKKPQAKIITVTYGKIFDVAVDLRKKSKTYGKVLTSILSENNATSIYVPPGFAHGLCGLSKENYVIYSCTKYREKNSEVTINIWDKGLNIKWPIKKKIVSKKDKNGITFQKYKEIYL